MAIKTLINFMLKNPVFLMLKINKVTKEFYRAGFVATALSEGLYDILSQGPASCQDIQKALGIQSQPQGLEAWLDLGVSLGELRKSGSDYSIKSSFSKALTQKSNDTWQAFFQARVEIFHDYIVKTPAFLKQNKNFELSESYGELFARSSRTVEPILLEVIDRLIPREGPFDLLEVGCGSGVYIRRACERNPELTATGLELQKSVADFARDNAIKWHIDDRVAIKAIDVRQFQPDQAFDLVSFYNLLYYFPMNERVDLFRCLGSFMKPGGRFIMASLCQGKDPSLTTMNLWSSMTTGCGPLPHPKQIRDQLDRAGFKNIRQEQLIPCFFLFTARK